MFSIPASSEEKLFARYQLRGAEKLFHPSSRINLVISSSLKQCFHIFKFRKFRPGFLLFSALKSDELGERVEGKMMKITCHEGEKSGDRSGLMRKFCAAVAGFRQG
jgi:hypothetical protein